MVTISVFLIISFTICFVAFLIFKAFLKSEGKIK